MFAGEQLVAGDAVRKDVGERIGGRAVELFRRHVRQGADERTLGRDAGRRRLRQQGDAEIHDLHAAVRQQHDVGGLHIAVDDALGVGMVQSRGHLGHDVQLLQEAQRPLVDDGTFQVLALKQFHDEVGRTFVLAEIVNDNDILVAQFAGGRRLVAEAREHFGFAGCGQGLDGNEPAHSGIVRAEHLAEAATPQLHLNFIPADSIHHPPVDADRNFRLDASVSASF